MHIQRTLLRLLGALTLTGASIAAGATVTVPDNGDIFLGVRASGGQGSGVSLLINVGDDTTFRNAAAGSTVSLSNVGTELTTAFGANWSTRSDLTWAFFGARNQTNPATYGTRSQSPVGLPAPSFPAQDLSQRTATKNQIISVVDAYGQLDQFNSNANAALQTNGLNSGSYSFQVGSAGTSDFGSLSQWVSIEGDFSAGASGTVLDFFRYAGSTTVPATERLGSFEISSAGALSFTRSLAPGIAGIKLAQSTFSVDEDAGTVTLTFRRTDDVSAAVSATFSTTNGSATSGTDYTAQTNVSVSFDIGEFQKTVTIPIVDRAGISAARDFTVTLASPSVGAELVSPSSATITILDTDSEVQFASATAELRALDILSQPNTVELTVNRTGDLTDAASVSVSITGGSLSSGSHFTFTSPTTVNFISGDASEIVSIPLNSIPTGVLPGTIIVTLSNPTNTSLGTIASSTVNVLPNSGEIAFNDAAPSANAVNAGGNPNLVTVNLTRTNGTVGAASVNVAVTGGTLTSGTHFEALANPTTVTFANGSDTASFTIQLNAIVSSLLTSGATIELGLSNPTNSATLGATSTSTLTIIGTPGSIAIGASSFNVFEEAGTFNLPIVRTGGTSGAVGVTVTATNGTATVTSDFTLPGSTASLADGAASVNFPITILNTIANEPNETFTVTISAPTGGATLGATTSASVTILDADTVKPALTLTAPLANAKILVGAGPNVSVTGSATDNKGVDKIEVQLNGGAFVSVPFTTDSKGKASFSPQVTAVRGKNIINVRSIDKRGNISALATRSFIYDDPFPLVAGGYNGLVRASGATTATHSTEGFFNVNIVPAGTFTGKLVLDGFSFPLAGSFDNAGNALFGKTPTTSLLLTRKNKPNLTLAFLVDLAKTGNTYKITGTLTETGTGNTSSIDADRALYTAAKNPVAPLVNPSAGLIGDYTLIFQAAVPTVNQPATSFPQGDGWATVKVSAAGVATVTSGAQADGSSFTFSAPLSIANTLPLYLELYNKKGSISGPVSFRNLAQTDLDGVGLRWFRPAIAASKVYTNGWPTGITTDLLGSKFVKAPAAPVNSILGTLGAANPTLGNAVLEFTDGKLTSTQTKGVNISVKNVVTNTLVGQPPAADKTFTLKIAGATGIIEGTFTHSDGKKTAFKGVILQKSVRGAGYFLSTPPTGPAATSESGAVTLTPRI